MMSDQRHECIFSQKYIARTTKINQLKYKCVSYNSSRTFHCQRVYHTHVSICYIIPSPEESGSQYITRHHLLGEPLGYHISVVAISLFENVVKLILVEEDMQVVPPHLWPFYLISYMDRLKSHSRINWNNLLMAISHCFRCRVSYHGIIHLFLLGFLLSLQSKL